MTRVARANARLSILTSPGSILIGMAVALALFYQASAAAPALIELALFGALALLRPDLALLFVPLTAPLYLIPANIAGIRAQGVQLPLHEAALLITAAAAAAAHWLRPARPALASDLANLLRAYAPQLLFLLAGLLGVLIAIERSRALREFRWVVVEPLLFYVLVKAFATTTRDKNRTIEFSSSVLRLRSGFLLHLLIAFTMSGAIIGLFGLLQYVGLDLVPLLGKKQCFAPDGGICPNVVIDGGLRRVLSVYGHPNNLGLALGRVWPIAAALALAEHREQTTENRSRRRLALFFAVCSLFSLGGLVVSFSRGAWLGAVAALAVLVLGSASYRRSNVPTFQRSNVRLHWLIGVGTAVVILAGLALSLRGDLTAGSTPIRLLLWREAVGYIRLHPLGIGLDQFGVYHDPQSPLSLIDPSLVGTSEQYAAHPHNLVLDIWLRLGPLGLVAFSWLLARCVRAALRNIQQPIMLGALAALVAALVHGLVDNFYFVSDLALSFWLLIALVDLTQPAPARSAQNRDT